MEANVRVDTNPMMLSSCLAELSDGDLLAGTRRLVGASNQLLASLLAHLAEVEARGAHRTRACSSLYTYCVYELRFSEDAAFRRVSAARLVRRFPALFEAIASGELHLTAVLMLGPHLTAENCREVLARAKHRTKREFATLVRELEPVPDVPARIEPLGPPPTPGVASLRPPTWEMFMRSLNPVRNLNPGERPRDWMDEGLARFANDTALPSTGDVSVSASEISAASEAVWRKQQEGGKAGRIFEWATGGLASALERSETALERSETALERSGLTPEWSETALERSERAAAGVAPVAECGWAGAGPVAEYREVAPALDEPALAPNGVGATAAAPAPSERGLLGGDFRAGLAGDVSSRAEVVAARVFGNELPSVPAAGPQRYAVQFTATAEHVELVERAQALLSGCREGASLAEVHLRAMRELVAMLEKRKYGVGARPRGSLKSTTNAATERPSAVPVEADSVAAPAEASSSVPVGSGTCSTAPSRMSETTEWGETGERRDTSPVGKTAEPREVGERHEVGEPREVGHMTGGEPRETGEPGEATQAGDGLPSDDCAEAGVRADAALLGEEDAGGTPWASDEGETTVADTGDVGSEFGKSPRWRGRHVPAAVRREVFTRDAGRCGYVDELGQRCRETRWLELHHLRAFALGGEHSVANLALRCRAHNALAAEEDFGREVVEEKRGSMRRESFASAARGRGGESRR